jgi:hypothetical protein
MLVKAIVTAPALAWRELVLYFSWPSGLAARLSDCPPLAGVGVEELVELEVAGAAAAVLGVEADELVALEELPQPASAIAPSARARSEELARSRAFD